MKHRKEYDDLPNILDGCCSRCGKRAAGRTAEKRLLLKTDDRKNWEWQVCVGRGLCDIWLEAGETPNHVTKPR